MSGVVIGYWACVCLLRNASYYVIFLFYLKLDFDMKLFEKIEIYILKDIVTMAEKEEENQLVTIKDENKCVTKTSRFLKCVIINFRKWILKMERNTRSQLQMK